jgi:ribosome maturation protein Sdo1
LRPVKGKQGILERPSKQILDAEFGTTKEDEIMTIILEKGVVQETKSVSTGSYNSESRF